MMKRHHKNALIPLCLFLAAFVGAQPSSLAKHTATHADATARVVSELESTEAVSARLNEILTSGKGQFSFVINFDYDKWDIRPEFEPRLDAIGRALSGPPPEHCRVDSRRSYGLGRH